ncbi:MAG: hypothetical protein ACTSRZ_11630 [Promethearchaeota archaeon]
MNISDKEIREDENKKANHKDSNINTSIANLKSIHKPKLIANIILLAIGIAITIFSIYEFFIEAFFIIPIATSIIGLYLIVRFRYNVSKLRNSSLFIPKISKDNENLRKEDVNQGNYLKFRSFPSSRLIITIPCLVLTIVCAIIFGVQLGESYYGNWLILNGFSLFYPIAFIPFVVSIGLIIYLIISSRIITIRNTQNLLIFDEFRFVGNYKTEIPKEDILIINFSNLHLGPKYIWCLFILPFVIYIYKLGFPLVLNPFAFGYAFLAGGLYIFSGTLMLVILLILMLRIPYSIEIITRSKRYEMQVSIPAFVDELKSSIMQVIGLKRNHFNDDRYESNSFNRINQNEASALFFKTQLENNNLIKNKNNEEKSYKNKNKGRYILKLNRSWIRLIAGVSFIGLGLVSDIFHFYAGDLFTYFLYIFGVILIFKSIFKDQIIKNSESILETSVDGSLIIRRKFGWFYYETKILQNSINYLNLKRKTCDNENYIDKDENFQNVATMATIAADKDQLLKIKLRKIDIFDLVFLLAIPFMAGLTLSGNIKYYPLGLLKTMTLISYFSISILVLVMLFFTLIAPRINIELNFADFRYLIPLPGIYTETNTNISKNQDRIINKRKKFLNLSVIPEKIVNYKKLIMKNEKSVLLRLLLILFPFIFGIFSAYIF